MIGVTDVYSDDIGDGLDPEICAEVSAAWEREPKRHNGADSNVIRLLKKKEPWGGFLPGDMEARPPEREWLVKDLIPQDEVVFLTGAPGAAKSKLLLQLQICAAFGDLQWIGRDVQQAKSLGLYLGEDDRVEQERRCWDICAGYGRPIHHLNDQLELNPRQLSDQWLTTKLIDKDLRWTSFGAELWQIIQEEYFKLIVIDTATKALGWMGRRDGDWVDRLIQMFRQKCVENHCVVVLTDHTNKSDRKGFSGVNPLLAAVRAAMNIYIPNDKYHNPMRNKRVLHELRSSYSSWEPIRLKWENGILVCDDSPEEKEPDDRDKLVKWIGEIMGETERGIQFYDGVKTVWMPKSQVEWKDGVMTMPAWLARKHGFVDQ